MDNHCLYKRALKNGKINSLFLILVDSLTIKFLIVNNFVIDVMNSKGKNL